ncbi:hypothetical protein NMY22_g10331 [Coprinellus aureogranulatus]|nr:hypothetical protein NMY22_g10331 [Coprinellus aureogranulatus]
MSTGVKTMMKCHYWKHNEFFPNVYELGKEDIEEVDGMIRFVIGDTLTNPTGVTKLYNLEDLNMLCSTIRDYYDDSLENRKMRRKRVGERQMICRVISQFYRERFFNLHGARGARLDSTQSIHYSPQRRMKYVEAQNGSPSPPPDSDLPWYRMLLRVPAKPNAATMSDAEKGSASSMEETLVEADAAIQPIVIAKHRPSIWMDLFSLAMFGGPNFHLRRLRSLTVDMKVNDAELQKYKKKMVEEWKDVNLYGTVLLAANVSFLAISSVDDAGSEKRSRTPSQRASYLSVLASMGTIAFSFMLLGRHRGFMRPLFIAQRSTTRQGLESLAVIYAAPFSLAVWSIVSFFISFAILWFGSTDYVVFGLIGAFSALFAFFLIWAGKQKTETKKMVIRMQTERKPEAVLPNQPFMLSLQACDTHKLVEEHQDQVDCRDSAYDTQDDDGENVELAFVDDEDAYDEGNISEKLDEVQKNLKEKESEVGALRARLNDVEGRLSKEGRALVQAEGMYRDQLTERNTLLLTIYQYLDKILGVEKTPKKGSAAETKPFTNFSVFHDNLITRLKALSQIQLDFDKRAKEVEGRFTEKLNEMRRQLESRWRQIDKFELSVKQIVEAKASWRRKLREKEGEVEALRANNSELSSQVSLLKRTNPADHSELRSLTARAMNAERRLNNAQNQLLASEEKLAALNAKTTSADEKWEARVREYESRLKAAEERVKRERQGGKERVAELEAVVRKLTKEVEEARKRSAQVGEIVDDVERRKGSPRARELQSEQPMTRPREVALALDTFYHLTESNFSSMRQISERADASVATNTSPCTRSHDDPRREFGLYGSYGTSTKYRGRGRRQTLCQLGGSVERDFHPANGRITQRTFPIPETRLMVGQFHAAQGSALVWNIMFLPKRRSKLLQVLLSDPMPLFLHQHLRAQLALFCLPVPNIYGLRDPQLRQYLLYRSMAHNDIPRIRVSVLHMLLHNTCDTVPFHLVQRRLSPGITMRHDRVSQPDVSSRIVMSQLRMRTRRRV